MKPKRSQRFAPREQCAIAPSAFGLVFELGEPEACEVRDGVAIVRVYGPLMRAGGWWFDSYESILGRVASALEAKPKAVLLAIDSPGGVVAGCFETARQLRALAQAAEVPLYAFTDGQATSAAYAIASAADRVIATPSATLGSIGVIDALVDVTAMDEREGVRFEFVASGARKTDGQPHVKIAPEAIKAAKTRVDELAEQFFDLVAEHRPVSAQAAKDLEAALVHGGQAVMLRLADEVVETFNDALAVASGGDSAMAANAGTDYEDGVAKLRKAAEGDDDEAKKAKRMLAAMDEDEKSEDDDDEKDDDEAKAEDDDEKDDDEEEAKAVSSTVNALATRLVSLEAKAEAEERAKLLAAYPHATEQMRAAVARMPIAQAKVVLDAIPKPKVPAPAAATTAAGTRGAGQGEGTASRLPPDEKAALDRQMGLVASRLDVRDEGNRLVLGAEVPLTKGA